VGFTVAINVIMVAVAKGTATAVEAADVTIAVVTAPSATRVEVTFGSAALVEALTVGVATETVVVATLKPSTRMT
jgi:hypothetical protein